jgi:hypothetical protein
MGTHRPTSLFSQTQTSAQTDTTPRAVAPVRQNSLAISNGMVHSTRVNPKLFANLAHEPLTAIHAIIVHQTDSLTAASTLGEYARDRDTAAKTSRSGVGAHFLIDKDGTIYQTANLTRRCRHVGPIRSRCYETHTCTPEQTKQYSAMSNLKPWSKMFVSPVDKIERQEEYPARYPDNADSIGIEIVGKHLGDDKSTVYEKPTDQQQASLHWLVTQLLDAYGLKTTDVYRHPQVSRKNEGEAKDAVW